MANAVLYNQGSHPTGALKSGTMSMNVSPSLDIGALKWRNGYENNNMWVIYSDTYSQGQSTQGNALPTIWASPTFTDAGLVNLINTLPARAGQTPFTDVTAATSWLRGQGVYFLSNQNYPQIVTNGLSFLLDAGFPASFPNGTGTTWYDLSGNDNNATLTNGPTWSNSGTTSFITFDGTDDWATLPTTTIGTWTGLTISCLVYMETGQSSGYPAYIGTHVINNAGCNQFIGIHNNTTNHWCEVCTTTGNYEFIGSAIPFQQWYEVTMVYDGSYLREYINGVEKLNTAATGTLKENEFVSIGRYASGTPVPKGKFQNFKIYNRHLLQSEILQNYYKAPIVTSGLTIMLDAGNIISYGGTGTVWKDLTTNGNNMNMVNGMVYNQTNNGELYMDGGDEYLQIPPSTNLSNLFSANSFTITLIVKSDNIVYPRSRCPVYVNGTVTNYSSGGPRTGWSAGHANGSTSMEIRCGDGTNFNSGYINHTVQESTVYHRTFVIDRTNGVKTSYYVNGVLQGSLDFTNITGAIYTGTGSDFVDGFVFGYVWGWRFIGGIYNIMVHNRALSANEVQQNFNAQRGRFGI